MPTRTYRIFWNVAAQEPPGGVAVTAEIPASWTESVDATGSARFAVPGLGAFSKPAITAIASADLESTIRSQFGDDLARATRSDRGGRTWIVATRATGHVHARLFAPVPGGVVIASVLLAPAEASKLPEIERAFGTVRVAR